jgi:hypothetical protein
VKEKYEKRYGGLKSFVCVSESEWINEWMKMDRRNEKNIKSIVLKALNI